ncbi:hypothetical protein M4D71_20670 [Niallia taxi]|uniref:hypothetical protein n=1 Tax=Niallia taxi TaxID=2499688 RepID=UPI0021A5A0E3|nr:hypothetical protein [Niallia taxi]MCT2346570.1 hypothetical protein [Niallia taxi]
MEKCLFCGKKDEGVVCNHCLAKGASSVGKFAKGAGKYVGMAAVTIVTAVIKSKFDKKGDD